MTGFLAFLAAVALVAMIAYLQLAYAKASYPPSWRWRFALFAPAFLFGALATGYGFASSNENTALFDVLSSMGMGFVFGILYAFVFPINVKRVIPKRKP